MASIRGYAETHVCDATTVNLPLVGAQSHMARFTISIDEKLANEFQRWIAERIYSTRYEAVRDLLRDE